MNKAGVKDPDHIVAAARRLKAAGLGYSAVAKALSPAAGRELPKATVVQWCNGTTRTETKVAA